MVAYNAARLVITVDLAAVGAVLDGDADRFCVCSAAYTCGGLVVAFCCSAVNGDLAAVGAAGDDGVGSILAVGNEAGYGIIGFCAGRCDRTAV